MSVSTHRRPSVAPAFTPTPETQLIRARVIEQVNARLRLRRPQDLREDLALVGRASAGTTQNISRWLDLLPQGERLAFEYVLQAELQPVLMGCLLSIIDRVEDDERQRPR